MPHHVRHVEMALEAKLPDEYKKFLRVTDGCRIGRASEYTVAWAFDVPPGRAFEGPNLSVSFMRRVGFPGSLLGSLDPADYSAGYSPAICPIARIAGPGHVCLSLLGDDFGAVVFWHQPESQEQERNAVGDQPPEREIIKIADGFEAWWTKLRPIAYRENSD